MSTKQIKGFNDFEKDVQEWKARTYKRLKGDISESDYIETGIYEGEDVPDDFDGRLVMNSAACY